MNVLPVGRAEMLILAALRASEQYGLEIVKAVKEITNDRYALSLGGLYTTLHRMERKGLIVGRWGETTDVRQGARRRYYKVTGLGERALKETEQILARALRRPTRPVPGVL